VAESAQIHQILDQLDTIAELDPESREQLINDLRRTKPSLWPAMVHQFRAALAYRRQLQERDQASRNRAPSPTLSAADREPGQSRRATLNRSEGTSEQAGSIETLPESASRERAGGFTAKAVAFDRSSNESGDDDAVPTHSGATVEVRQATPEVQVSSAPGMDPTTHDWKQALSKAIVELEQVSAGQTAGADAARNQMKLRLLYLAADRRDEALRPLAGTNANEQDFWSKEIFGLAALLDEGENRDFPQRAALAGIPLSEAVGRLAELSPLRVQRLAFCTEVTSFGVYKPFGRNEFLPGQEVLLYAEVSNFLSNPTDKGYHTALRSRYEILDAGGLQVDAHDFSVTEDLCRNRRHDFFMRYFVTIADHMPAGDYTLKLLIEDTLAGKMGEGAITFALRRPGA
jgi:hypothetical protein